MFTIIYQRPGNDYVEALARWIDGHNDPFFATREDANEFAINAPTGSIVWVVDLSVDDPWQDW